MYDLKINQLHKILPQEVPHLFPVEESLVASFPKNAYVDPQNGTQRVIEGQ